MGRLQRLIIVFMLVTIESQLDETASLGLIQRYLRNNSNNIVRDKREYVHFFASSMNQ